MKSRPLKVGEYRKVKTWDELLATEGAELMGGDIRFPRLRFLSDMGSICGTVLQIDYVSGNTCLVTDVQYTYIAEFFTDDYYDENGNEVKMSKVANTGMSEVLLDQWVNDIDTLDQLEATTKQDIANSNKVLDQIALMREIDLKQVEIDQLIEAQNKRIEEYEKGAR